MSLLKNRKGSITIKQWFLIFAIFAVALAVLGIYYRDVKGTIEGKTFEKNYFARDIALLIDAIYASPGELTYTYSMRDYEFKITIRERKVTVIEPGGRIPTDYRYADDASVTPPERKFNMPSSILFTKTSDELKVEEK